MTIDDKAITQNGDLSQLGGILTNIINDLLIAGGFITSIVIVVRGIRYILSAGDPKATQSAKSAITVGIIGLVIILLAVLIVQVLGKLLGSGLQLNVINIG